MGQHLFHNLPLLYQILEVCIIPLLGVLTAFIVKYINVKSGEIQAKVENDTADKYIALLLNIDIFVPNANELGAATVLFAVAIVPDAVIPFVFPQHLIHEQ